MRRSRNAYVMRASTVAHPPRMDWRCSPCRSPSKLQRNKRGGSDNARGHSRSSSRGGSPRSWKLCEKPASSWRRPPRWNGGALLAAARGSCSGRKGGPQITCAATCRAAHAVEARDRGSFARSGCLALDGPLDGLVSLPQPE